MVTFTEKILNEKLLFCAVFDEIALRINAVYIFIINLEHTQHINPFHPNHPSTFYVLAYSGGKKMENWSEMVYSTVVIHNFGNEVENWDCFNFFF